MGIYDPKTFEVQFEIDPDHTGVMTFFAQEEDIRQKIVDLLNSYSPISRGYQITVTTKISAHQL